MLKKFRIGGVHPPANKLSSGAQIVTMPLPLEVVIPLAQHIGAPAQVVVEVGDEVVVGQLVGQSTGFVSANVHSSVSGQVVEVGGIADGAGVVRQSVRIEVVGDRWAEEIDRSETLVSDCTLSSDEIIDKITQAGIVGMGGATFPTQVKLAVPPSKRAEALIINGVECEPYLTADHRVMLERGAEVLVGAQILAQALGVDLIYIGIENNKPDAIAHLTELARQNPKIKIVAVAVKYPQGGEKQLIDAVVGRQVPSGALPIDVGVVVQNVGTALAVYQAVQKNKPLVERVVTVTGRGVAKPQNLLVRIGTPTRSLIEYCGGLPANSGKVVSGGPMMGRAMVNLDAAVTKGSSGVLIIEETQAGRPTPSTCIKCAKCVTVCPMGLEPYMLSALGKRLMFPSMESLRVTDCIECGSCSYTCPANLPLLDYIRLGKVEVVKIIRGRK